MILKPDHPFHPRSPQFRPQKGNPVSKRTKVVGKRIAGAQRAEQARQQARRDHKH